MTPTPPFFIKHLRTEYTVVTPAVAAIPAVTHLLCGGLPIVF